MQEHIDGVLFTYANGTTYKIPPCGHSMPTAVNDKNVASGGISDPCALDWAHSAPLEALLPSFIGCGHI